MADPRSGARVSSSCRLPVSRDTHRLRLGSETSCQLISWDEMDADTAILADREVQLADSAYRGGSSCPGRRLGTSSNGVEPAQELGDGADLGDALVQCRSRSRHDPPPPGGLEGSLSCSRISSGRAHKMMRRLWRVRCRFRNGAPVVSIVRTGLGATPEAQVGFHLGQAVRFRSPI
jgi:hypothetical protein